MSNKKKYVVSFPLNMTVKPLPALETTVLYAKPVKTTE